jgi:hypothetical protein
VLLAEDNLVDQRVAARMTRKGGILDRHRQPWQRGDQLISGTGIRLCTDGCSDVGDGWFRSDDGNPPERESHGRGYSDRRHDGTRYERR